jgi:hypothetical protein
MIFHKNSEKETDKKRGALVNKQARRVLFAASISLLIYGGILYWYKTSALHIDQKSDTKPVAFVASVEEDVHRRPAARLIWQLLGSGEPLYPGEAIRTSSRGQIRIQFAASERYLDLDPDSLIVISQSNNEISLDLMDGSLFVAGGSGDGKLTLNSAKGKVDLSKATASLSKTGSGQLDFQILKGSAQMNGQSLTSTSSLVKLLSPKIDVPSVINPESVEPIHFSWNGLPADTNVSLWLGPNRKDLRSIAQTTDWKGAFLDKKLPVGKHFFKLVAADKKTGVPMAESQVYRLEVVAKYPPGVIAPAGDSYLVMDKALNPVTFKWTKPESAKNVYIEIAKDSQFKNPVTAKSFLAGEENFVQNLSPGDYFWRLSANYEGLEKPVGTKTLKFSISPKPKNLILINWTGKDEKVQYFVDRPQASFSWDSPQKTDIRRWRLVMWPAIDGREPSTDESQWHIDTEKDKREAKLELPTAGNFNSVVEAYNEHGALLGKSNVRTLAVESKPLLQAPQFYPEIGELKADNKGNINLKWTKFEEAKEYTLVLMDKEGKELKRGRFGKAETSLVNLMPGQYQVEVIAKDIHGRESERSKARAVLVPETSGLKAPKLKKVKVN